MSDSAPCVLTFAAYKTLDLIEGLGFQACKNLVRTDCKREYKWQTYRRSVRFESRSIAGSTLWSMPRA